MLSGSSTPITWARSPAPEPVVEVASRTPPRVLEKLSAEPKSWRRLHLPGLQNVSWYQSEVRTSRHRRASRTTKSCE